jgi:chaperonin GroES
MATKTKPAKTTTDIRPLHDKIIVRRDEASDRTEAGIYIPEAGKERPKTGIVLAIGDGQLNTETGARIPLTVAKGDRVIFTSYAGTEVKLDDEELLIMSESEVLGVIA